MDDHKATAVYIKKKCTRARRKYQGKIREVSMRVSAHCNSETTGRVLQVAAPVWWVLAVSTYFPVGLTRSFSLEGSLNVASDMFITCLCSLVTMWIGPIINFDMQYYTNIQILYKRIQDRGVIFALLTRIRMYYLVLIVLISNEE